MASVEQWRLIETDALPGDYNMALDVALVKAQSPKKIKPVLRLYSWGPFAISLGFHQSINEINTELCDKHGIDIVFRPTGGRAILHAQELTYSVILPASSSFYHKEILPVYDNISKCLVRGLQTLGIPVVFERSKKTPKDFSRGELSSICYASSIQHEIGINGRKLVGSAQRRYDDVVLQHGSILIGPAHLDLPLYLTKGSVKRRQTMREYMEKNTICLNEIVKKITIQSLKKAVKTGFEKEISVKLVPDKITDQEHEFAKKQSSEYLVFRA
jgi:lipoyl(octanoyl) transferase